MSEKAPISPHLQIYRLPVTAVASIFHRGTGAVLAALLGFAAPLALLLLAYAPATFDSLLEIACSSWLWPVRFLLVFTLVYHMMSGIRHLLMDLGLWLEKGSSVLSAWLLFALSSGLSLVLLVW